MECKWSRKEFWTCGILMIAGMLAYHTLYIFNVYPFTEGWGIYCAELINRGQIPYKDFFYYLPPLSLLTDWVHWNLSFDSLLMFRLWYLFQRIVMVWLLYRLLTKWFAPRYAWIACLTAIIFRTAVVWDLGGDYNQTQTLLAIILTYTVVCFLERDADSKSNSIWRYKYIFVAGIIIAMMVLLKQSAGLAALIVCFGFLIAYCSIFHDKHFFLYCLATAMGALIPLGICVLWLANNKALIPFMEQFFGVAGAKGGIGTILLGGWVSVLTHWRHILMYTTFLLMLWSARQYNRKAVSGGCVLVHILAFCISCLVCYEESIYEIVKFSTRSTTFTLTVSAMLLFVATLSTKRWQNGLQPQMDLHNIVYTVAMFFAMLILIVCNYRTITTSLFYETSLFTDISEVVTYFCLYANTTLLICAFVNYRRTHRNQLGKATIFLLAGCLLDAYANMMNSSDTVYPIAAFMALSVMICFMFYLNFGRWNIVKNILLCVVCVTICGSVMIQKYTTAYSWWGSEITYPMDERCFRVDVPKMEGIRLAEQRKLEFEEVTKLIQENGTNDSTVWGFPYVKIFNILTNHYNTEDPVPILFYDVCSDEAALKEAAWLKEHHPDFVIWCDMPWCIEVHESTFRNGEVLGQREIIEWFIDVKKTSYTQIGQVGNLFVYKLKNGEPINYTYFQSPDAKNKTAGES